MNLADPENADDKLPQRLNQPRPMSIAKDGGTTKRLCSRPKLPSECIVRTMFHVKHSERELPRAAWASYFSVRSAPPFCAVKSSRTTMPPFMTNFTRCISEISCRGSPETAIRSAYLPFSIVPMVSSL
jgi:hypothetical protein